MDRRQRETPTYGSGAASMDDQNPTDGPQFEVWNHLWSGVDLADNELRALDARKRTRVEKVGKLLVDARTLLAREDDTTEAIVNKYAEDLLSDPWIKHAAELELARAAVSRAETALSRYFSLQPAVVGKAIPARATKYVAEVIQTFAFGFDAACIALCRATAEQVLKDELVAAAVYTEAQIRRERPTAGTLLIKAKQAGIITTCADAGDRLVKKGDTVMHQFIYDDKISETQARDSIKELLAILCEVLGTREGPQAAI
jgi:hypothetical protein